MSPWWLWLIVALYASIVLMCYFAFGALLARTRADGQPVDVGGAALFLLWPVALGLAFLIGLARAAWWFAVNIQFQKPWSRPDGR